METYRDGVLEVGVLDWFIQEPIAFMIRQATPSSDLNNPDWRRRRAVKSFLMSLFFFQLWRISHLCLLTQADRDGETRRSVQETPQYSLELAIFQKYRRFVARRVVTSPQRTFGRCLESGSSLRDIRHVWVVDKMLLPSLTDRDGVWRWKSPSVWGSDVPARLESGKISKPPAHPNFQSNKL